MTRTERPVKPAQASAKAKPEPAADKAKAQKPLYEEVNGFPADASFVGTPEQVVEDARAYAWWSTEQPIKPEQLAKPAKPAASAPSKPAAQSAAPERQARMSQSEEAAAQKKLTMNGDGRVRLPSGGELNWMMDMDEPSAMNGSSKRRSSGSSRMSGMTGERKMNRRKVVALLAGGAVAASAAAIGAKFLMATPNNQTALTTTQNQTTNQTTTQPTTGPQTTNKGTQTTKGGTGSQTKMTKPGHTGTVITTTKQANNTAVVYGNNNNILVRLSNGNFVAYNRACTHQGIAVNYHPDSQTLICPLHGATFDPKNQGMVLKGPAVVALAMAKIQINADGTITAV
jgi:Rieske Fe-S protein